MTIRIIGLSGERYRATPSVEVDGMEGYELQDLHTDVNGKWGGHKAVVAHFVPLDSDDRIDEMTMLYILVGDYWKVGKWPDDDPEIPSIWETAKLLISKIEDGIDISALYSAIANVKTDGKDKSPDGAG